MPQVSVDGVQLHYEIEGEGPPLLVLHGGLGVDHTIYRRTLAPLTDEHRLVYLDHRGNGRSGSVDVSTITMEQLADDAAGVADALGLPTFGVFGHSYGGFIGQELALRHPERVSALMLVCTTPGQLGSDESPEDDQGPPPPPELAALMSTPPTTDAEMQDGMQALLPYYFPGADLTSIRPLFADTRYRVAAMARGFEVLARWSSVDRLRLLRMPTLVVGATDDHFTSAPQSTRIANRIPGAELLVIDGSGHFPWIQQPASFFPAVQTFLARHRAAG